MEIQLIYHAALVLDVQQDDSEIYIYIYIYTCMYIYIIILLYELP